MGVPDDRWAENHWTERRAELDDRIHELHRRNDELADRVREDQAQHADGGGQRPAGSTPAQVGRAEALARLSSARALEAYRRAAIMRLRAASAHDRAARTYENLRGNGEAGRERQAKAEWHRRQATADRAAALDLLKAAGSQPTGPGGGEPGAPEGVRVAGGAREREALGQAGRTE